MSFLCNYTNKPAAILQTKFGSEVEVSDPGRHRKLRVSSRGPQIYDNAVDNSTQTACRDQVGMSTSVMLRSACGCYQTNKPAVSPWETLLYNQAFTTNQQASERLVTNMTSSL